MGKYSTGCIAYGCGKRRKRKIEESRSDSEGSSDDGSENKRKFPRTFHKYEVYQVLCSFDMIN